MDQPKPTFDACPGPCARERISIPGCPECREGKVYRQREPKTLIRIVGQAPLKATVFEMETAAEPAGAKWLLARRDGKARAKWLLADPPIR